MNDREDERHRGQQRRRVEGQGETRDRQDALISAGMDDELGPEERARLAALLGDGSESAARAHRFQRVDEDLRSLAEEPIAEARLADTLASLQARLGIARVQRERSRANEAQEAPASIEVGRGRRWGISSALAAAAAFVLYLVLPAPEPMTEESFPIPAEVSEATAFEAVLEAALVEDLALILGPGDAISGLGGISNEDLDVIERLDLLDLVLARETRERG